MQHAAMRLNEKCTSCCNNMEISEAGGATALIKPTLNPDQAWSANLLKRRHETATLELCNRGSR